MSGEWIFSNSRVWYDYWEGDLGGASPDGEVVERVKAAMRDGVTIAGTGGKSKFRRKNFQLERYWKGPPPFNASEVYEVGTIRAIYGVSANVSKRPVAIERQAGLLSSDKMELADRTIQFDPNQAGVYTVTESWQAIDMPAEVFDADKERWVEAESVIEVEEES
jgi:hypothetical protein